MFTFTKQINSADAFKQIVALTANFEHLTVPQAAAIQKTVLKNLPADTVFGYVMYPNTILTEQDITKAMRYNDSKDTHFTHFTVWYEVAFVFLDFHAKQIMCWGIKENVQDALEGIQELLNNAVNKKTQKQKQNELRKAEEQRQLEMEKLLDDRMDCWEKDYMANKHL